MDKNLFDQNHRWLKKNAAHIFDAITDLMANPPQSTLFDTDTGPNLRVNNTPLYNDGAPHHAQQQVDAFRQKPIRKGLSRLYPFENPATSMMAYGRDLHEFLAQHGLEKDINLHGDLPSHIVVFGLGLGYHIDLILKHFKIRNLLLIENEAQMIYHAMHLHDFRRWAETLRKNNGKIYFSTNIDASMVGAYLQDFLAMTDPAYINGLYLFQHYASPYLNQAYQGTYDNLPSIFGAAGFIEDEDIMMRQFMGNITLKGRKIITARPHSEKNLPALIIGSGPSLDSSLDLIRRLHANAVVISCGTALGALLNQGIRPDFHVELENVEAAYLSNKTVAEKHDLSGIRLICSFSVRPELSALFDNVTHYFRDSITATTFFDRAGYYISNTAPTVTNLGTRMAFKLGFTEIFLFGIDMGARNPTNHHSKSTIYYRDEKFIADHPEIAESYKFPIPVPGNFGGTVYTNTVFSLAEVYLSSICQSYAECRLLNFSDGARLRGTIPQIPESFDPTPYQQDKQPVLQDIDRAIPPLDIRDYVFRQELHDLKTATFAFHAKLAELFQPRPYDPSDLIAFIDRVSSHISDQRYGDNINPQDKTICGFYRGTWTSFLMSLGHLMTIIPPDLQAAAWDHAIHRANHYLERDHAIMQAMFADLETKLNAAPAPLKETRP